MMIPDEGLANMAREGDQRAAEQLFRRYHDRIFSYLFRLIGDRGLAEDAAQETFIKGFRGLKTYREKGLFKSWLFKIAHREGLRVLKKENRRLLTTGPLDDEDRTHRQFADPDPLPAEILITKEEIRRIEHALEGLNEDERQVVLLRLYEGLPFKAIASMLKCPLNTALGRMHTALKKLKKELSKEGIGYEM